MRFKVPALILVLALQGCSSDTPSTSDVEKALQADYISCPNIVLNDVKIVNGRKISNQVHEVEATFNVSVNALPKAKVEEAQKLKAEYDAEMKQKQDRITELHIQMHAMDQEMIKLEEFLDLTKNAADQEKDAKLKADWQAKLDEAKQLEHQQSQVTPIDLVAEWGGIDCLKKAGIEQPADAESAVVSGMNTSFHGTINMEKTDNGWMKAN